MENRYKVPDRVEWLTELLSPTLTAFMLNQSKIQTLENWIDWEGLPENDDPVIEKLDFVYEIILMLNQGFATPENPYGSRDLVRAWLIGVNGRLGDTRPVEAIRNGQFEAVRAAARDFSYQ